ncbi:mitoferrin-1-like [Panonychus citri]|uniref:mitoferrin-1-like n=1 Tax=Panonychus citri TaxID=50023 RepID=UPI002307B7D6|nr:mitoferrin-1-like [Panonychus citri]
METSNVSVFNDEENSYESLPSHYSFHIHMAAGALAGIVEHCVMFPVDSVKTRMQILYPSPKATYKSVPEALFKIVRHEGIKRPFRGVSVMLIGAGPAHAFYFSIYEKVKRSISGTETGGQSPIAQMAAGCLATVFHDAWMNPAETVKQRLQIYNSQYSRAFPCFMSIFRNEGMKAFYRSYTTQLSMNIPFHCVHLVAYEYSQELFNPNRQYNPTTHIASGAIGGAVASAITTPLDVCKTLLNTQDPRTLRASKQARINGFFHAIGTIYRCCGIKGYFNGLTARVIYSIPSTALSWLAYESFKAFLKSENS